MTARDEELDALRYPVGRFTPEGSTSPGERTALIDEIETLPDRLRGALAGLSPAQLDTPYRPGGWTVRQVVHHLPDSHINGYIRFKLATTETEPRITLYDQAAWAELPDAQDEDVETSLVLLESLHRRWVRFLRAMDPGAFRRTFLHPESGPFTLETALRLYAWHGRHHLAHVTNLRKRRDW